MVETSADPQRLLRWPAALLGQRRLLLTLLAAILYFGSHPPFALGAVTGWFCLAPLLVVVRDLDWRRAWIPGWCFGFVANLLVFYWIFAVPGFGLVQGVLLAAYLGLYPALWTFAVRVFGRAGSASSVAFAASSWVLIEFLRDHAGFLALPWATLAQTQVDSPLVRPLASVFGEPGLAFAIVWGNALVAQGFAQRAWTLHLARGMPLLMVLGFGAWILETHPSVSPSLNVAVLQTEFPSFGPRRVSAMERMRTVVGALPQLPSGPLDLVALPESTLVNPALQPGVLAALQETATRRGLMVIAGHASALKFDAPYQAGPNDTRVRNGALVFQARGPLLRYEKQIRVPFAEYMPLASAVRFPEWLVPRRSFEVVPGVGPSVLAASAVPLGLMVCWEALFADHARQAAMAGAHVLIQLANEGWFTQPAAGLQHVAAARMRAIENHMPIVVAANAAPAAVIDGFGRVVAASAARPGLSWLTASVSPATAPSAHARWGFRFPWACIALTLGLVVQRWRAALRVP